MQKNGSPKVITTDKLASCSAAFREIGVTNRQLFGGQSKNRYENSYLPFRRNKRAMQRFKTATTLQNFVSYHGHGYNYFNHEKHLETRQIYKQKHSAALIEYFQICAS